MIKGIHHIGISVCDLERELAFFQHALGSEWAISTGINSPGFFRAATQRADTAAHTAMLRGPNCYLELIEFTTPQPDAPVRRDVNEAGITHTCVQSQSMGTLRPRFAEAGASFHADPVVLATGNTYCYARDGEANVIEIEALPYAPPDLAPWVAHVAIATPDIERLANFYHRVLGGTRMGGQKIGPHPLYDQIAGLNNIEMIPTWLAGSNVSVELWQYRVPPTMPRSNMRPFSDVGYNHICFEVDDVANTVAVFQVAGATVETPQIKFDGFAVGLVRDPDGNVLELLAFSPSRTDHSIYNLKHPTVVQHVDALQKRK